MGNFSMFDIIGPVMIGPSSSHTAGAARIGKMVYQFVGDDVTAVSFYLHGSFAKTYRGHGTDKALLAGVLGFSESDEKLKSSFEIANSLGIEYAFLEKDLGDVHPNSVLIEITRKDGSKMTVMGSSIGGGNINIIQLNGIDITISGDHPTIVAKHNRGKGIITSMLRVIGEYDYDVLSMSFHKSQTDNEGLIIVELAEHLDPDAIAAVKTVRGLTDIYLI